MEEESLAMIDELKEWGCDIDDAMTRFLDDEDFYITCLYTMMQDPLYDRLGEALRSGNVHEAFEQAHTLKGVLANMGLTPIYNIVVQLLEPLRAGNGDNLMPIYDNLILANEQLKAIVAKNKS